MQVPGTLPQAILVLSRLSKIVTAGWEPETIVDGGHYRPLHCWKLFPNDPCFTTSFSYCYEWPSDGKSPVMNAHFASGMPSSIDLASLVCGIKNVGANTNIGKYCSALKSVVKVGSENPVGDENPEISVQMSADSDTDDQNSIIISHLQKRANGAPCCQFSSGCYWFYKELSTSGHKGPWYGDKPEHRDVTDKMECCLHSWAATCGDSKNWPAKIYPPPHCSPPRPGIPWTGG